jgi:hypothetical protein
MISDQFNQKVVSIKVKIAEKERLEIILSKTRKKLQQEESRFQDLAKSVKKEESDVKKLESKSLTALFSGALGTKEQKLQKEQQEFVAAQLKYDKCASSISFLKRDIKLLKEKIKRLGDPKFDYYQLLKAKEDIVKNKNYKEYTALVDHSVDLKSQRKEIGEAIAAGEEVQHELNKVLKALKSAGNWGTFDLLGGGLLATAVKHSKIDNAKRSVHQVQHLMDRFYRELSDVDKLANSNLNIEIGTFDTFADYFFDGLIFDWIVQSKIKRSLENTKAVASELRRILFVLKKKLQIIEEKLKNDVQAKNEFLETI